MATPTPPVESLATRAVQDREVRRADRSAGALQSGLAAVHGFEHAEGSGIGREEEAVREPDHGQAHHGPGLRHHRRPATTCARRPTRWPSCSSRTDRAASRCRRSSSSAGACIASPGMVEQYKETLDFFAASGVPLRASVNLTLSSQDVVFESNTNKPATVDKDLTPEPVSVPTSTGPAGGPAGLATRSAIRARARDCLGQRLCEPALLRRRRARGRSRRRREPVGRRGVLGGRQRGIRRLGHSLAAPGLACPAAQASVYRRGGDVGAVAADCGARRVSAGAGASATANFSGLRATTTAVSMPAAASRAGPER